MAGGCSRGSEAWRSCVGIVFFVAMAVRRGWIGEEMRVVLAFLGSGALVGAGLYLFISQGRTQASLAAVASGLAGLYASDVAATRLYDLVSPVVGLACAGLIGALGTAIAIRWETRLVGAIGILGALASPILVQAETSGTTLAFMAIALVAAVGVLLWQRWDWLAAGAFLLSAPQLAVWLEDTYEDRLGLALGSSLCSGCSTSWRRSGTSFEFPLRRCGRPLRCCCSRTHCSSPAAAG